MLYFCQVIHPHKPLLPPLSKQLDVGVDEKIMLMSRDEQSCLIVSYKEIKNCIISAFNDLRSGRKWRKKSKKVKNMIKPIWKWEQNDRIGKRDVMGPERLKGLLGTEFLPQSGHNVISFPFNHDFVFMSSSQPSYFCHNCVVEIPRILRTPHPTCPQCYEQVRVAQLYRSWRCSCSDHTLLIILLSILSSSKRYVVL